MRLKKAYLFLIEATNDIEIFISVAYFGPEKQTDSSKSLKKQCNSCKKVPEIREINPDVEVKAHFSSLSQIRKT